MRRGVLVLCGAALVAIACRQIVGIDDQPAARGFDAGVDAAPEASTTTCGLALGQGTCAQCAAAKCCDQAKACAGDRACAANQACNATCNGEPACRSQCFIDHPYGLSPAEPAMASCLATNCASECALACGGIASFIPPDAAAKCQTCADKNNCADLDICARDPECVAIQHCKLGCVTGDCGEACEAAHDAGLDAYSTVVAQALGHCLSDCAIGNYWFCTDHLAWPAAKASSIAITFALHYYGTTTPVPGALVKLCNARLPDCSPELGHDTTDAEGKARFTLAMTKGLPTSQVYFDISNGTNLVPELFYPAYPFSEATADLSQGVFEPAQLDLLVRQLPNNVMRDPTRGDLAVQALDCILSPTPGAVITSTGTDGMTTQFYLENGLPQTAKLETDVSGLTGFIAVNAGSVTMTITPKSLGKPSSVVTATVRKGTLTVVNAGPQPP